MATPQAAEFRQEGSDIREKLPDIGTSKSLVDGGKILVKGGNPVPCRLHGPGSQCSPPISIVIRTGTGGFRRWSKGFPGTSKSFLDAIGVQRIAKKARRLGVS